MPSLGALILSWNEKKGWGPFSLVCPKKCFLLSIPPSKATIEKFCCEYNLKWLNLFFQFTQNIASISSCKYLSQQCSFPIPYHSLSPNHNFIFLGLLSEPMCTYACDLVYWAEIYGRLNMRLYTERRNLRLRNAGQFCIPAFASGEWQMLAFQ